MRRRSDSGTLQEPTIVLAILGISAFVGYKIWGRWGALAGPGALLGGSWALMILAYGAGALYEGHNRRRLMHAARTRTALPAAQWRRLIANTSIGPRHRAAVMEIARDRTHPMCEAFLALALKLTQRVDPDPEISKLAAEYVADTPGANGDLVIYAVQCGPVPLMDRIAGVALDSEPWIAGEAARALVLRAHHAKPPDREELHATVRSVAARLDPHLTDWDRNSVRKIVG